MKQKKKIFKLNRNSQAAASECGWYEFSVFFFQPCCRSIKRAQLKFIVILKWTYFGVQHMSCGIHLYGIYTLSHHPSLVPSLCVFHAFCQKKARCLFINLRINYSFNPERNVIDALSHKVSGIQWKLNVKHFSISCVKIHMIHGEKTSSMFPRMCAKPSNSKEINIFSIQ